jgi:hypothetical protein
MKKIPLLSVLIPTITQVRVGFRVLETLNLLNPKTLKENSPRENPQKSQSPKENYKTVKP